VNISGFSPVASAKTFERDGFGDGDGDGNQHPGGAIVFELVPLLGGFCARFQCAGNDWRAARGAAQIRLTLFAADGLSDAQNLKVYDLKNGQNMNLQKTVFGLAPSRFYKTRFVLMNATGTPVFVSSLQIVQTLS
jgi:hypothetical protein